MMWEFHWKVSVENGALTETTTVGFGWYGLLAVAVVLYAVIASRRG